MTTPTFEEATAVTATDIIGELTQKYLAECRRNDELLKKITDLEAAIKILNMKECSMCGCS